MASTFRRIHGWHAPVIAEGRIAGLGADEQQGDEQMAGDSVGVVWRDDELGVTAGYAAEPDQPGQVGWFTKGAWAAFARDVKLGRMDEQPAEFDKLLAS
jgi:hypothetical protein